MLARIRRSISLAAIAMVTPPRCADFPAL